MDLYQIYDELEILYPVIAKCPFCGHASSPNSSWHKAWVECDSDKCGASGPQFQREHSDPMKAYVLAIEAWGFRSNKS